MLGQPSSMLIPPVLGVKLSGRLPAGTTATDLVLTITERLRKHGVVGKFVEFYGPGLEHLTLADRATLGNMCPEYGATIAIFPIDAMTLDYLRLSGREASRVELVEAYAQSAGLLPRAGQRRSRLFGNDRARFGRRRAESGRPEASAGSRAAEVGQAGLRAGAARNDDGEVRPAAAAERRSLRPPEAAIDHGSVVIAAITSCTNTSNPSVMIGAGLVARKAVEKGLTRQAVGQDQPGPRLEGRHRLPEGGRPRRLSRSARLQSRRLRLHDLHRQQRSAVRRGVGGDRRAPAGRGVGVERQPQLRGARAAAGARQLSGVAAARRRLCAGRIDDAWISRPSRSASARTARRSTCAISGRPSRKFSRRCSAPCSAEHFRKQYAHVFQGDERWQTLEVPIGDRFAWEPDSTYVRHPPFLEGMTMQPAPLTDIVGARVLALLGDSITTDHISPAGSIKKDSPAGQVSDGARRAAAGLQLVRRAPRQPRGDDARHVREHAPAQPARAGHRRRVDHLSARRRGDDDLRRGDAVQGGRRPAHRPGRQGIRIRIVARLGGEGHAAARRQGGHRRELRADPSQQPGEHGRAAAAVPGRAPRRRPWG